MKYEEYKDSGVKWIGVVPSYWEVRKIKSLSIVKRGASPRPIEDPKYFDDNGEYAWVRIADVSNSERYLEETTQTLSKLGASLSVKREPGDIFISIAGTVGKPIITHIKCCIHDGFVWFPYLRQNTEFLYYLFMSGQPYLGLGKMGTQLNLNTEIIGNIQIPLPPLPEQQTIAAYLDEKCGEINRAIDVQKKKIELLNELKQTIITDAVTKGLNPNAPMKDSGVEWIGVIPEHWKIRRTRFLCKIQTGDKDTVNRIDDGRYPFYVRSPKVERIDSYTFDGEAVLMAGDGVGAGKVFHYANGKFDYHQRVYNLHNFKDVGGLYYYYYISNKFKYIIEEGAAKNTVDSVRLNMIQDFWVTIPPLSEQQNIVAHIEKECAKIDLQMSKANRRIELLNELKQSIITEAVTGKIKVC